MIDKDPSTIPWLAYVWVIILSLLGGMVNFANRVQKRQTTWRDFAGLFAELITSVFVGVVTYYVCEWQGFAPLLTAALVGVTAHMGTRAIFQWEKFRNRILGESKE